MSAGSAVTRLASMDGEELRFRLACEARKIAGLVRHAVRPPQLARARLARILDPAAGPLVAQAVRESRRGDYLAAHRALSAHIATRASRWPLQAGHRESFVAALREACPDAMDSSRRRADRIVEGHLNFLGYRDVRVGSPPDWHADVVHGRRAPLAHWTRVRYLDPGIGDHKIIWEINRHQYWLTLGTAYWLTGDRRYRDTAIAHLQDWLARNPPLEGINWSSMLELAFRALSWTWAVEFFGADGAADETPWLVDLFVSLDAQLRHISQNLSRYFSPNTHLTGEALALYAVSAAFPELRRSGARMTEGRGVLVGEIKRQIHPDGGHKELSAHYHHYTTDFYLLALMIARAAGDPAAPTLEEAARRTSAYLRTIADEHGVLPLIGDDDGGQLFRFRPLDGADASGTLCAAASILSEPALAVTTAASASADSWWILGRRPEAPPTSPVRWPSRVLPDSGYFVSRADNGGQLIFDAGPHGFLNGGHAHADALSIVLNVAGLPLLVDPGTATYIMDDAVRDRLRSARMHNTATLDGREYARPRGPFHWDERANARLLFARADGEMDFAVGTHAGYGRHQHTRGVLTLPSLGWLIVDRVSGAGRVAVDTWWHLHPSWRATSGSGRVDLLSDGGSRLALATTAKDIAIETDPAFSAYAPEYGRVERGTTLRASSSGAAPLVIGTFIPASSDLAAALTIVELRTAVESGHWIRCEFAVTAGTHACRVSLALPFDPEASLPPASWPQPCIEQLVQLCVE